MATGTWISTRSSYGKGTGAWTGNQGTLYLGNSYCCRLTMTTMKAVSVASKLDVVITRGAGNGSFPIWFYASASDLLAGNITSSAALLGSGTLTTGTGKKTYSIAGSESKLNGFTDTWYLYIVSDATYRTNTVAITGGTGTSAPQIQATYESSAVYVNVNGVWKAGQPWVKVNGSWVQGVPWVNANGSWKIGY